MRQRRSLAKLSGSLTGKASFNLEVYLVGGAVRDELLGRPIGDRDWVVVGGTEQQMQALGYTQVGRDFPVYLHPQTHEEYALARTERKQGQGHRGFVVNAAPEITLEEDLQRRDLTINAIAKDHNGDIIDPYHGVDDLHARIFRHVSPAFAEDPLRVFRVARLAAVLPEFSVAPETVALMRQMAAAGALRELAAERVWQEFEKALSAPAPGRFFTVLKASDALQDWFAPLTNDQIEFQSDSAVLRFAELPLTDPEFSQLAQRLKVPHRYLQVALHWLQWGEVLGRWRESPPEELCDAFATLGVGHSLRQLTPIATLVNLRHQVEVDELLALAEAWGRVKLDPSSDLTGRAYGAALRQARLALLAEQRQNP